MRKAAALIVMTVRLRACIRPLDEAPSASGHDGDPLVSPIAVHGLLGLAPLPGLKTPVRPVRHHHRQPSQLVGKFFPAPLKRLAGRGNPLLVAAGPEYASIFVS